MSNWKEYLTQGFAAEMLFFGFWVALALLFAWMVSR